jgi:hypothetical protein
MTMGGAAMLTGDTATGGGWVMYVVVVEVVVAGGGGGGEAVTPREGRMPLGQYDFPPASKLGPNVLPVVRSVQLMIEERGGGAKSTLSDIALHPLGQNAIF